MAGFLQEESDKVLSKLLSNTSSTPSRTILKDNDDSWYKIPYQISFGGNFKRVTDDLLFRTQNLNGVNNNTTGVQHPNNTTSSYVSEVFGLDGSSETLAMLNKAFCQDTRVGGNDAINCLWQFNRDDDILHDVFVSSTKDGMPIGLSRVYANTTQTNQQLVYFTFGVPYYTSILMFHKQAFSEKLITINQQGYDSDAGANTITELLTEGVVLLVALPILPLKLFYQISEHSANNYKINRFYELRGRMQLYYRYVDSMLGHWLVSTGMYGTMTSSENLAEKILAVKKYLPKALQLTGASIWDIITRKAANSGYQLPDLGKRNAILKRSLYGDKAMPLRYKAEKDKRVTFQRDELISSMDSAASSTLDNAQPTNGNTYLYNSAENSVLTDDEKDIKFKIEQNKVTETFLTNLRSRNSDSEVLAYDDDHGDWARVFYKSALGATQFIGFRVDKSTDASESFSNSTSPSAFAEDFNSKVRQAASQMIDSGIKGASADDSWIGSVIQDIKSIGRGIIEGLKAIDFIGLTDLANAAMTGAYIDIPEQYSGSDFNKSHSLSFQLRSPYGDKVSIYQSIIVPLFCILAGALPRAGGPNSYVQPFLCRVYCKGMFAIPMGIIDSISIKRGDSEFGWTYDNIPTCVDVSISIKDMSPIMYMTIYDKVFGEILGNDTAFNEYLLTLSGVGLFERISQIQKVLRGAMYTAHAIRGRYFNPVYWSHSISQYAPIQFVASFIPKIGVNNN